ncbi:ORF11 [Halorubrum pleomorphic virus 2]|uniref:ORF11 n=1 Tax=Halorubrum pleomorphic virus 2 TaxID=1156719 RepID=H9ABM5_9VIRU|nr:ORF11 [Halorubrum pleomorphic virus 2]AFD03995.1 ORF11 [Halorubrum pleomorphic virus 2]
MSESSSRQFETDKFGNKCARRTEECARALANKTDAFEVVVHDAETGRIGYRSKRTVVNDQTLAVARRHGYEVDLISATSYEKWDGEMRKCAGIEFVPEVSVDE